MDNGGVPGDGGLGDLAGDERQQPQRGAQDKNHHRLDDRRNPGGHDNRSHHVGQDHQGGDGTDLLHDRGKELPEVGLGESLPLLIAEGGDTDEDHREDEQPVHQGLLQGNIEGHGQAHDHHQDRPHGPGHNDTSSFGPASTLVVVDPGSIIIFRNA